MIECYAKIVDNQITEVSSGIGTSGTWIKIEGYEGENQTLTYDVSTNTVKVENKIDEKTIIKSIFFGFMPIFKSL